MLSIALLVFSTGALSGADRINPPMGAYINLRPEHFADSSTYTAEDRLVVTPYFYWYDVLSGAHLTNPDGSDALTDHPAEMEGFSYKHVAWHRQELIDMEEAGIQVVMPVYWGEPSQVRPDRPVLDQPWSYSGVPPLVAAREELLDQGRNPPRIGMFYDTSTLEYNAAGTQIDLTTDHGRQWFYESVRDFFSLIPPKHWAMVEGKPIVFLYSASFAADHDQSCIDYLASEFAREFGGREPYVVREVSWKVVTPQVYAWGGALGLKNPGVASLGPGYDHSAVPGREPLVVDREQGEFFRRNWIRFLRDPSSMVMIETWNEFHEGTQIADSAEYGREYIELNRHFTKMFHQGIRPPLPRGEYSDVRRVRVELAGTNVTQGLVQVESADGATEPATAGGVACRAIVPTVHAGRYVYYRIDDSFKWADTMRVDVEVHYYDQGPGSFTLQFDGSDTNAPFQGAYTAAGKVVTLGRARQWAVAEFSLDGARFRNSQNGGCDFRIQVDADTFYLREVVVTRLGVPEEAGSTREAFQQDFAEPLGENWAGVGVDDFYHWGDGMLSLDSVLRQGKALVLLTEQSVALPQETLARVRLVGLKEVPRPDRWACGGIAVSKDLETSQGIALTLWRSSDGSTSFRIGGGSIGGTAPVQWTANQWLWMRLRHAPNAAPGAPDVFGRIWPADAETEEPNQWQVEVDYYPEQPMLSGHAGLMSPSSYAATALECDYVLIQTPALPPVSVRLPALKPARASLSPGIISEEGEFGLRIDGSPMHTYFLQMTSGFAEWVSVPLTTDALGRADYLDSVVPHGGMKFYRASVGE